MGEQGKWVKAGLRLRGIAASIAQHNPWNARYHQFSDEFCISHWKLHRRLSSSQMMFWHDTHVDELTSKRPNSFNLYSILLAASPYISAATAHGSDLLRALPVLPGFAAAEVEQVVCGARWFMRHHVRCAHVAMVSIQVQIKIGLLSTNRCRSQRKNRSRAYSRHKHETSSGHNSINSKFDTIYHRTFKNRGKNTALKQKRPQKADTPFSWFF